MVLSIPLRFYRHSSSADYPSHKCRHSSLHSAFELLTITTISKRALPEPLSEGDRFYAYPSTLYHRMGDNS